MVRRGDAQTLSEDLYDTFRTELLAGGFAPGERLVPVDLCERYGAKPGVVREALARLAAEGLTTLEPNRGYRVIDVTRQGIEDLLQLRRINEGAALRMSVERADAAYEAAVIAAHHVLRSTPPSPERARAHHDFHLALLSACGNSRLLELCESLFEASELYRQWSVEALRQLSSTNRSTRSQVRDQDQEHQAILQAVLAHDADRAVTLHLQHLQRTVELALAYAAMIEEAS